ncbi:MAG: IS5 family transposase [Cyanobacteria bacterium P01_B01_bin.77]
MSSQLNRQHRLMQLAESIDWSYFDEEFGRALSPVGGRPPIPTRLMVGLHYLKALYDESDESVVSKWVENLYWQYFCGEETSQHELPCHPTSLVKWRKQVGPESVEKLLKEVLQVALEQRALKPREIERVNVDTTVQEKAIAFPTDARLYDKARCALVKVARHQGIQLRRSYARVGKQAFFQQSRYRAARQQRWAKQQTRKLRTYLGRVIRDIDRKAAKLSTPLNTLMIRANQIYRQTQKDSPKLYS